MGFAATNSGHLEGACPPSLAHQHASWWSGPSAYHVGEPTVAPIESAAGFGDLKQLGSRLSHSRTDFYSLCIASGTCDCPIDGRASNTRSLTKPR